MSKTLQQSVKFSAPVERVFSCLMDSKEHSAFSGGKSVINRKVGGRFSLHNGMIIGKNLLVAPKSLIVQSWRVKDWGKSIPDSILVFTLEKVKGGTLLNMTHANIPEKAAPHIKKGWNDHYWTPMKKYLKK